MLDIEKQWHGHKDTLNVELQEIVSVEAPPKFIEKSFYPTIIRHCSQNVKHACFTKRTWSLQIVFQFHC